VTNPIAPGVQRQDVVPPPVPAFNTGVPAFLGYTGTGQTAARALRLWTEFGPAFGEGPPGGYLAAAVQGFFANGGARCQVVGLDPRLAPVEALRRGLSELDHTDEIDLLCLPDLVDSPLPPDEAALRSVLAVQRALLEHCSDRGDRFAVLDAVPAAGTSAVIEQRTALLGEPAAYGALYHPWIALAAPGGSLRLVPPCGHVVGAYSAGDQLVGVHKPPAGAVLDGPIDLQTGLDEAEIGTLTDAGVNCLRPVPGRGIRVWGARTLSADPAWRDICVRRVVGTVCRWVQRFMAGLTMEPNDIRLRVRILRELTAYLDGLYRVGALRGRTEQEAFFVKCDAETNPPEIAEAGLVVTQIGLAPAVGAEFIVVRVVQSADQVTVAAA
jgi:phage tail sheath protein FI